MTTLTQTFIIGEVIFRRKEMYENSLISIQFFCTPKTALKNNFINFLCKSSIFTVPRTAKLFIPSQMLINALANAFMFVSVIFNMENVSMYVVSTYIPLLLHHKENFNFRLW